MKSIQRMKLTGAAILVSRGMKVLQAAPAAYPYRSAAMIDASTKTREGDVSFFQTTTNQRSSS
jgi:hypothetical protein